MKPNIKKLLILNAPYLLFVWLFMKIGEAFRLSPGADLSGKLLHMAKRSGSLRGLTSQGSSYTSWRAWRKPLKAPCQALTGRTFYSALPGRLSCALPST